MAEKHIPITGGCLCGAVRYESTKPPVNGGYCHCRMCQKASGGLYTAWVEFSASEFRFTKGEPKLYRSSGWGQRGVCAACGSSLAFIYDENPAPVIFIGTLDHPDDWPLTQEGWSGHAYVDDKVSWHVISDDLPQFALNYPDIPEGQTEPT
jgi:hypothetical protein